MTEQERTRLLETAQRHLDALTAILDRLASLGAEAESPRPGNQARATLIPRCAMSCLTRPELPDRSRQRSSAHRCAARVRPAAREPRAARPQPHSDAFGLRKNHF